jgi:hypothetical protein
MSESVETPLVEVPVPVVEAPVPVPVVEAPVPVPVVEAPVPVPVPVVVSSGPVFVKEGNYNYNFIYGSYGEGTVDVTDICYTSLLDGNNIITITNTDVARDSIFGDPCIWRRKNIYIVDAAGDSYVYGELYIVYVDIVNNTVTAQFVP